LGAKRAEFVNDGTSYITPKGRLCDDIVLNVHAPTEDKDDDIKDSFSKNYNRYLFDQFPNYHMNILLGDFNAKAGREDIFKPITGNENPYEVSNDNGVRNQTDYVLIDKRHSDILLDV
jgi:exonuclease III